jgi:FKBP-type peptidyl-prolyl cis-trans isomerase FkpA
MTHIGGNLMRTATARAFASATALTVAICPAVAGGPAAAQSQAVAQAPAASPQKSGSPGGASETLPSGVQIRHSTVGTGPSPTPADKVKVHYRGTLADGQEFDSSHKRGQPAVFPLGRVVPCWTQGLQKLKIGGKATLTCPPATAYGSRGVPNVIPPDSTLTFEVELLSIEPQ